MWPAGPFCLLYSYSRKSLSPFDSDVAIFTVAHEFGNMTTEYDEVIAAMRLKADFDNTTGKCKGSCFRIKNVFEFCVCLPSFQQSYYYYQNRFFYSKFLGNYGL